MYTCQCFSNFLMGRAGLVFLSVSDSRTGSWTTTLRSTSVYCILQVYTVYYKFVLYTTSVYCVLQVYTVYYKCILYTTSVYCIVQVYTVYYKCILYTTCVYCILQVYTVYYKCILYTTCVYSCSFKCVKSKPPIKRYIFARSSYCFYLSGITY